MGAAAGAFLGLIMYRVMMNRRQRAQAHVSRHYCCGHAPRPRHIQSFDCGDLILEHNGALGASRDGSLCQDMRSRHVHTAHLIAGHNSWLEPVSTSGSIVLLATD